MDNSETFKLDCACGETIKIPVPSVRNGAGTCPVCGVRLTIDWGALAAGKPVTKPEAVQPFEHPAIVLRRAYERELDADRDGASKTIAGIHPALGNEVTNL
jgi:hypothetical protein